MFFTPIFKLAFSPDSQEDFCGSVHEYVLISGYPRIAATTAPLTVVVRGNDIKF